MDLTIACISGTELSILDGEVALLGDSFHSRTGHVLIEMMMERLIVVLLLIAKCHLTSNAQLLILFNGRTFPPEGLCQLFTSLYVSS